MKKKWILIGSIAAAVIALVLVLIFATSIFKPKPADLVAIENMLENNGAIATKNSDGSLRFVYGNLEQDQPIDSSEGVSQLICHYAEQLGIQNPSETLAESSVITYPNGTNYRYQQMHQGIPVLGGELSVSLDAEGVATAISNNTVTIPQDLDMTIAVTESDASSAAIYLLQQAYGCSQLTVSSVENVIYVPDEGEPYYAWHLDCAVSESESYTVIISTTGKYQPYCAPNQYYAVGTGENSFGETVSFTVTERDGGYAMVDPENHIEIYDYSAVQPEDETGSLVTNATPQWNDETEVDLMTNFTKVQTYVREVLGLDSIDNKGVKIRVVDNIVADFTNAAWCDFYTSETGEIVGRIAFIYNKNGDLPYTMDLDICAHEYGHGLVNYYVAGYSGMRADRIISRSWNEAYADIFACCVDGNWILGESYCTLTQGTTSYVRSAESPATNLGYKTRMPLLDNGDGLVYYYNSTILSHAAYKMNTQYKIPTEDLARIWINSLRYMTSGSDFNDVRDAVVTSAVELSQVSNQIRLSDKQLAGIITVFEQAGLTGHSFEDLDPEKAGDIPAITSPTEAATTPETTPETTVAPTEPEVTEPVDNVKQLLLSNVEADSIQYYKCAQSGNFAVIERNGKFGIIGYDGSILLPIEYDNIGQGRGFSYEYLFADGYAISADLQMSDSYPDGGGVEPDAYWYNDELVVFLPAYGIYGGFDMLWEVTVEKHRFPTGMLPIRKMTGITQKAPGPFPIIEEKEQYALLDVSTGKLASDFIYSGFDTHNRYSEGLLAVKKGDKWGFIDEHGRAITGFIYDAYATDPQFDEDYKYSIYSAVNGYITVLQNGKWGLIDVKGNTILDTVYEGISQVNPNGKFWLKENGTWSLYQLKNP